MESKLDNAEEALKYLENYLLHRRKNDLAPNPKAIATLSTALQELSDLSAVLSMRDQLIRALSAALDERDVLLKVLETIADAHTTDEFARRCARAAIEEVAK